MEITEELNNNSYSLNFIGSSEYSIIEQRLREHFAQNGVSILDGEDSTMMDFTLIEARTDYPEIFKDHIFGNYLISRTSKITYSYSMVKGDERGMVYENAISLSDTVLYSDLPKLENVAYSFTSSEVPDEPFFSSALEPVIAIGTAAVAVYLFFNIRSK
ncbi:MAG: hypothetical protein R3250_06105 [Melioribacteraceae bacterium]|nr:hypothetical protein [Melioribacteraceae bacterium]